MKKRFILCYTIFATLFILFTLSYLGFNLYNEYKIGSNRTRETFDQAVTNVQSVLKNNDSTSYNFINNISNACGNLQDYSFFEIKKNRTAIYSYPINTLQEDTTSNFTKNFTKSIYLNNNNYLITGNLYLLRPYSIYHYSQIAFFMILGLTLLTIILIIASNLSSKKELKNTENDEESNYNNIDSDLDNKTEINNNIITNYNPKDDDNKDNIKTEKQDSAFENKDTEYSINENNIERKSDDLTSPETNLNQNQNNEEPEGLFSESTGFGWESYLLTRLDNEINRAISSEMDISLFVIKLANLSRKSELTKKICDYIALQFQFRDLLFEYKEDSIVAIKTGDNLDDAMIFAEKLYEEISKMLEGTESKCYIGISTRSVRMISGERFLREADEAVTHAQEDENNPIIAFKADIEKYRKYLEQKFDN